MTNTVNTNNQNLRLSALSVGLRSTLRLAFPNIPTEATRVEIIVTNEIAVSYAAEWNAGTAVWECDIPASQFMKVGKQKYEVAYLLDGEQFWDGQGWIEIVKATTKGILPNPEMNTTRYYITSINGIYGATEQDGNVRIPALYTGVALPPVANHIENDQFFNTVNNSLYVLANGEWKSVAGNGGGGGGSADLSVSTTWSNLVAVRNAGGLVTGCVYRITDYVCTTTQANTSAANHPFDILVTAEDWRTLNEQAKAVAKDNDNYFHNISAWQLWYCLDNDATRFSWANTDNGKGVIYRMIDGKGNDLPYDFKNIVWNGNYTFSDDRSGILDLSEEDPNCRNVIVKRGSSKGLILNRFSHGCNNITVGENGAGNIFGIGCGGISLGYNCIGNKFNGDNMSIRLGDSCTNNTFDNDSREIEMGDNCSNCDFDYCYNVKIDNGCMSIILPRLSHNISIGQGVMIISFTGVPDGSTLQNIEIKSGVYNRVIEATYENKLYRDALTIIQPKGTYTLSV